MKEVPRATVVIPCYNAAHYVGTTLQTVLQQTVSELEVIVIDDGSTDNLLAVVQPFLDRDTRVRLIRQENRGLAGARNRGINEAGAEFVAPIDADDVWHPAFLEEAIRALDYDPEAPFAYAYVFRLDEQDRLLPFLNHRTPPRHDLIGLITLNSVACGSAAVFRKQAVLSAGGYDERMSARGLHGAEDWKLVVSLASKSEPALVPRHLVGYRLDAQSMSQRNPARQLRAVRAVLEDLQRAMPEVPARVFRDSETMMIAWLLPAFAARGDARSFGREFLKAYLGNPLWILNPLIRRLHVSRLTLLLRQLITAATRPAEAPKLWDARFAGERPFAYLQPGTSKPII